MTETNLLSAWELLLPSTGTGSLQEKVAAWYPVLGGLATGLAILSAYSESELSVRTPRWFALKPAESRGSCDMTPPTAAPPRFSAAVKYSGLAESFSVHAGRGKQSSTGQRLSDVLDHDAESVLDALWSSRPDGTLTLVLQELLDITRPGALFHAYSNGDTMTVELIGKTGRSLLVYSTRDAEPAYTEDLPTGSAGVEMRECQRLADELRNMLDHVRPLGDDFNVEGFIDSSTGQTWVFQLRPVPTDRPNDTVTVMSIDESFIYHSRYTWGIFDEVVVFDGSDEPSSGIFWRTRANFDTVTAALQQRLRDGDRVLLVDTVDGFRLSHEPWNLPEPDLRARYRYMHVPSSLLDAIGSAPVWLLGDGDMAWIKALAEHNQPRGNSATNSS